MNVLVCGTPGTGKSTLIDKLRSVLPTYWFLNISQYAIDNNFVTIYDESLQSHVLDEDKLLDNLEPIIEEKEYTVIESIHADMFDKEMFDCVFVCRTSNSQLYDRLKARKYSDAKIENNLQSEIFQTILDEAKEQFGDKVIELRNDNLSNLKFNVDIVVQTIETLLKDRR